MFKRLVVIVVMVLILVCSLEINAFGLPSIQARRITTPPRIDGKLDDACWRLADKACDFVDTINVPAHLETEVYLVYDAKNLYIAFLCHEPNPELIQANATGEEEKNLWRSKEDDVVAIFIVPDQKKREFYQLASNPKGFTFDKEERGKKTSWESNWQVATSQGEKSWIMESAIPLSSMNIEPEMGNVWRINFCRYGEGGTKNYTWAPVAGEWRNRANYGFLNGIVLESKEQARRSGLSIKDFILPEEPEIGDNCFLFKIKNIRKSPRELEVKIKCLSPTGKERVTTQDISLAPRSLLEINTRATFLAEQGRHKIEIEFIEKGKSIYTSPPANVTIPSFIKGYLNQNIYTVEEKAHFLVDVFLPRETLLDKNLSATLTQGERSVRRIKQERISQGENRLTFDLKELADGNYEVKAVLSDKKGHVLAEAHDLLRKLPPQENEFKIDQERRIFLRGSEPFFPLGIFLDVPPNCLEEFVNDSAFNMTSLCLHRRVVNRLLGKKGGELAYLKEYMDASYKYGLLCSPYYGTSAWSISIGKAKLGLGGGVAEWILRQANEMAELVKEEIFTEIRRHPGMAFHILFDEPSSGSGTLAAYRTFKEVDPYHPAFSLFCSLGDEKWTRKPYKTIDALSTDPYIGGRLDSIGPLRVVTAKNGVKPMVAIAKKAHLPYFVILQADWFTGSYRGLTVEEQRCQTYLALIHGATGIGWFRYRPPNEAVYQEIKKLTKEIESLKSVLLEERELSQKILSETQFQPIHLLLRTMGKDIYLFTANTAKYPVEATIFLPELKDVRVEEIFKDRTLSLSKGILKDKYEGYAVHIYKIPGVRGRLKSLPLTIKVSAKGESLPQPLPPRKHPVHKSKTINLIPNSSAELVTVPGSPPDFWRLYGGACDTYKPPLPHWSGSDQLIIDKTTSVDQYQSVKIIYRKGLKKIRMRIPFHHRHRNAVPGKTYTYSVYLKADRENYPVKINSKTKVTKLSTDWKRYVCKIKAKTRMGLMIAIWLETPGAIWIDAAQIEEGERVTPYIEDTATKAYWQGKRESSIQWSRSGKGRSGEILEDWHAVEE